MKGIKHSIELQTIIYLIFFYFKCLRRVVVNVEGMIQAINDDGTFDIVNKLDGKILQGMPPSIVSPWKHSQLPIHGMSLVANYRGSGEWLPGQISDERNDGRVI